MIPNEPTTLPLRFESHPPRRAVKSPDPRVVYGVDYSLSTLVAATCLPSFCQVEDGALKPAIPIESLILIIVYARC
jgi:hypothetical protein